MYIFAILTRQKEDHDTYQFNTIVREHVQDLLLLILTRTSKCSLDHIICDVILCHVDSNALALLIIL